MRKETIGNATLYLGDCLTILPELHADAVITDPPYGISYRPSGGNGVARRGNLQPVVGDERPFDPAMLLSYPLVVLWGANHYAERLPSRGSWLVWYKKDGVSGCEFADCEMAWCSYGGVARVFNHRWHGMIRDSEKGNLREHPTQKPIAVMKWCIEQAGMPKSILDPFMGSGTTGVAAVQMGLNFTGIEIEPSYFEVACERIANAQRQERLFA